MSDSTGIPDSDAARIIHRHRHRHRREPGRVIPLESPDSDAARIIHRHRHRREPGRVIPPESPGSDAARITHRHRHHREPGRVIPLESPDSDAARIIHRHRHRREPGRVIPPESPGSDAARITHRYRHRPRRQIEWFHRHHLGVLRPATPTDLATGPDGQPSAATGIPCRCCGPQHQDGVHRLGQIQHPGFFIYYCAPNSLKAAWTTFTHLI